MLRYPLQKWHIIIELTGMCFARICNKEYTFCYNYVTTEQVLKVIFEMHILIYMLINNLLPNILKIKIS